MSLIILPQTCCEKQDESFDNRGQTHILECQKLANVGTVARIESGWSVFGYIFSTDKQ